MVQRRRPLELRAGQIVEAHRDRHDRHRRRCAGQVLDADRLGRAPARGQDAGRRADELYVRRRLVGHGQRRHAGQRRRHSRQDELCAGRRGETAHRFGLRRQGDRRPRRRPGRALRRRRSRLGRQCRAVQRRRRLGTRGLCRRADPPSARRGGKAHARPRHWSCLVRNRRATGASSTSRSRRRRWRSRASR